jgi:hypothetical protein
MPVRLLHQAQVLWPVPNQPKLECLLLSTPPILAESYTTNRIPTHVQMVLNTPIVVSVSTLLKLWKAPVQNVGLDYEKNT